MTEMTEMNVLNVCEKSEDCPRPGLVEVKDLATGDFLLVCRPHRREIYRSNALHVGHCEHPNDGAACPRFPYTMREVNGSQIVVCRYHESVVNATFATSRVKRVS